MINVNVIANSWTIAGVIASFLVAFIALFLGVMSLRQTKRLQEEEKKQRLLAEIIEWAEYIKNASVTPDVSGSQEVRDVNILMRYGTSFSKGLSIETTITEKFKKELFEDFLSTINALAKFMCIRQYSTLHTFPSEQSFPKNAIDEVKKEISNNKPVEQLFDIYAIELTQSINPLLVKANKIKAGGIN